MAPIFARNVDMQPPNKYPSRRPIKHLTGRPGRPDRKNTYRPGHEVTSRDRPADSQQAQNLSTWLPGNTQQSDLQPRAFGAEIA